MVKLKIFIVYAPKIYSSYIKKKQERLYDKLIEWLSVSETTEIMFLLEEKYDCVKSNIFHDTVNLICWEILASLEMPIGCTLLM